MKYSARVMWCGLVIVLLFAPGASGVKIVTYNLLNYSGTNRATEFKAITNGLQADIIVAQEISTQSGYIAFLNNVLNASGGPGGYAIASFFFGYNTNNALYYKTSKFTFNAGDPDSFKRLTTTGEALIRSVSPVHGTIAALSHPFTRNRPAPA